MVFKKHEHEDMPEEEKAAYTKKPKDPKEHKTWNFHMGGSDEGKQFRQQMKATWNKLTDIQVAMVTTEQTLTDSLVKAYDIPDHIAQAEVDKWLDSL